MSKHEKMNGDAPATSAASPAPAPAPAPASAPAPGQKPGQDLDRLARMFKALANPHRLSIYRGLSACWSEQVARRSAEEYQNCQCYYADKLGLAPSTICHHFKELRGAGLIHMRRDGKDMLCWIDRDAARELRALLGE